MGINFNIPVVRRHMEECEFGLEKENLRVTPDGFLSHTKHPFPGNLQVEKDFCESQTEMITGVWNSVEEVCREMEHIHMEAAKRLLTLKSGKEFFWPFSNPPYIKGERDITIAVFKGEQKKKEEYRKYLARKYGRRKMLYCGIHVNVSFPDEFLMACLKESGETSLWDYKNKFYLELAQKTVKYSWLLVYLMAASPVFDGSFFKDEDLGKDVLKNYASPRCSEIGYWNPFIPILDYGDLGSYIQSIQKYIDQGMLREAAELYYPVRLKPEGENSLENLKENGINHIELRMMDLNPLSPIGIRKEDLQFLHLFLLYLLSIEEETWGAAEQIAAVKNERRAARYHEESIGIETRWNSVLPVSVASLNVLSAMEKFYDEVGWKGAKEIIYNQKRKVVSPENRYVVKIRRDFQKDYVKRGLELAKKYALLETPLF